VSGPLIYPYMLHRLNELKWQTKLPIIAGGGIYTADQSRETLAYGASAVSFGTVFLRRPWMPNRIVRTLSAPPQP